MLISYTLEIFCSKIRLNTKGLTSGWKELWRMVCSYDCLAWMKDIGALVGKPCSFQPTEVVLSLDF